MGSKNKGHKKGTVAERLSSGKPYLPRPGTVPDWVYKSLAERPMLFGELSSRVSQGTGMSGDNLASQLSATLRDLIVRGTVVRINHKTSKVLRGKNQRGALYSLVPAAKASYLARPKDARVRAALVATNGVVDVVEVSGEPKRLDLSRFSPTDEAMPEKPPRMPVTMYSELRRAEKAARDQLAAIKSMLGDPAWQA